MIERDFYLTCLREELRACLDRREILLRELEGVDLRSRRAQRERPAFQAMVAELEDSFGGGRVSAIEQSLELEEMVRDRIAKHLVAMSRETVQRIRADSDDGALFELLSQVGGRMPEDNR
jgi:hypothetical protein